MSARTVGRWLWRFFLVLFVLLNVWFIGLRIYAWGKAEGGTRMCEQGFHGQAIVDSGGNVTCIVTKDDRV